MRHTSIVLIIFSLYSLLVVAGILGMAAKRRFQFLPELLAVYFALSAFFFFEYIGFFHTPWFVLALVVLTVLLHGLIGEFIDIYHKSGTFDRWLHLLGAFAFALFVYSIIDNTLQPPALKKTYIFLFVTAIGMALGTLFEIIEFAHDFATRKKPRLPSQHGLKDTDTDLIFNSIGAVLAGLTAALLYGL